ncbi:MAG: signal peptidase I [Alphaproteobacteria bacterium]|nr:MAG: signal peptidase I [Alphaproteobacteria bacterium]
MSERAESRKPEITEAQNAAPASGLGDWLRELVTIIIVAVVASIGIRSFLVELFNIPSESMLPTLMIGDYLVVTKYSYGYSRHSFPFSPPLFEGRIFARQPRRGDVVVFKLPRDGHTDYIKRVIGLPGDRIQVIGGQLIINGKPVKREHVGDFRVRVSPYNRCPRFMQEEDSQGRRWCRYPQYRETLPNGVTYMTLDLEQQGRGDNTRIFTVPPGHYFMMGDNRDNSADSRLPRSIGVGYVPAENLVGRAEFIFFSTDGSARWWNPLSWFTAVRWDRLFLSLHPEQVKETGASASTARHRSPVQTAAH